MMKSRRAQQNRRILTLSRSIKCPFGLFTIIHSKCMLLLGYILRIFVILCIPSAVCFISCINLLTNRVALPKTIELKTNKQTMNCSQVDVMCMYSIYIIIFACANSRNSSHPLFNHHLLSFFICVFVCVFLGMKVSFYSLFLFCYHVNREL